MESNTFKDSNLKEVKQLSDNINQTESKKNNTL